MNEQLFDALLAVMDAKVNTEHEHHISIDHEWKSNEFMLAVKKEREAIEAARKLWREAPDTKAPELSEALALHEWISYKTQSHRQRWLWVASFSDSTAWW